MKEGEPVVVTQDLTKKYGEFTALDRCSFSVPRGRILGFIGPNGAGKTTCIKILVGLARPTSGTARIAGADCTHEARRIKRLVGFMPDRFGGYDNMRVREYLDFFGAAFGIKRKARAKRIDEVLEITNATWMKDRFVESLSHGMAQRVGISRTLLHDPEVLIFDEPANGLDPQARIEMRELLVQLARMGKTLIVTSHILPELARICDLVAIITSGRLRAFGTLAEIGRQISQQRTIELQLTAAAQIPDSVRLLRPLLEAGAEIHEAPAELMVRFRTSKNDDELASILTALVQGGIQASQFRELQTDLEEAFLTVTKQSQSETVNGVLPAAERRATAGAGARP
jgi:ABC-2 type transport system ATP-binding protein